MIANYHTHTFRCHHATGTEREYIETAIAGGLKTLGFSDHVPFRYPDGHESGHRVFCDDISDYRETLTALREEYRGRIDIRIGFEMEYLPEHFPAMLRTAVDAGAEYLILGQHFVGTEYPVMRHSAEPHDRVEDLETFADLVASAIKSGAFSYVAHPDMFRFVGDKAVYQKGMERICRASLEYDIPLEVNFLGIRDGRHYPNPAFWELVGKMGCKVIYGCDAHDAPSAFDAASLAAAEEMRARYGLRVVDTVPLRDPAAALAAL